MIEYSLNYYPNLSSAFNQFSNVTVLVLEDRFSVLFPRAVATIEDDWRYIFDETFYYIIKRNSYMWNCFYIKFEVNSYFTVNKQWNVL